MNIMIVFPDELSGCPGGFKSGKDSVYFRSHVSGLKSLAVDTLVLLPGCSAEQRQYAIERTKASKHPMILQ